MSARRYRNVALAVLAGSGAVQPLGASEGAAVPGKVTVIRGGTIYDGSSTSPVLGDVVLRGDTIVYAGTARAVPEGARVIDAKGMIVAPGFIDPHTHAQRFLDSEGGEGRLNLPWLMQGVTTIFSGVDGGGTPEVKAFLDDVEARTFGTNVAAYVGFGPVRRAVLGHDDRAPDAAELARMKGLVAKGMCEGALGLSTGLFYAPQSFSKTGEVIALAREAGKRGGIYDTHQRDEATYTIGVAKSVEEAITIGREAGLPVHFAHIKVLGVDVQGSAGRIIAQIEKARAEGQNVTADQYPWEASGTSLQAALLPGWAQDGGRRALLGRLDDPATLARIRKAMAENMRRRGGPHALLLTNPGHEWTSLRLDEIAARWQIDPLDAAVRIIRDGDRSGKLVSFNMAESDIAAFMRQPWVVTSSDGSEGHPRMYANFPRKYAKYVRTDGLIDLATFINSSTGRTADMFGLADRGYLKAGYKADVVVFDPGKYRPVATYTSPRELTVGVDSLFVNGRAAILHGKPTGIAAGRAIRHHPPPGTCPS
ncbi:N-acyl-D-amino-acid deacylase family protein [Novosphingobium beihaiensis]|uniref:Amidohydrolase family protein n=1 Tax=Novosphingobium beihaiensis TaxID=2930389 RepID=A0ABT0BWG6_9SPHN|nr:amidohydrolase family protein [Novosphingobium beihaiensis]MCJ2188999.1 amidohydrolase family protein [Novosphingobium beihaiensis]